MSTLAPRRLLLAGLCLAGAALACARAEVAIEPGGLSVATALVLPPTATQPPVSLATPTSELAEGTAGPATAGLPATATPASSATPPVTFFAEPLLNGTFDTDLSGWNITPNWVLWQTGYARLNAAQAGVGAQIVQITTVPAASEVRLRFSARSEDDRGGECVIESHRDTRHTIPADGQWHTREVDFSLSAGTQAAVSLQARNNNHCEWVHLDDVLWLVATDGAGAVPATATSDAPAQPSPEQSAEATGQATAAPPTPAAIPASARFTQDLTVSAVGDTPIGVPADLIDGQALTWASLRSGTGAWVFNLGSLQTVAGVRVVAHRDGNQDTTVLGIDVSADGAEWVEVYRGAGVCDAVTGCEVIAQGGPVELAFAPTDGQYVRLRSGPTRFALAEVEVAVVD